MFLLGRAGWHHTGEPRTAKQAQEAQRVTNLTGTGAAMSCDATQNTTLQSQGTVWLWCHRMGLKWPALPLGIAWIDGQLQESQTCASRACSSVYGASMASKRMDYKEMNSQWGCEEALVEPWKVCAERTGVSLDHELCGHAPLLHCWHEWSSCTSDGLQGREEILVREEIRAMVRDNLRKPQVQGSRSLRSRAAVSMVEEARDHWKELGRFF